MFFKTILVCWIFVTSFVESKKYDLDLEAQKLYGENLARVLARFRKTADYVKILSEKTKDLHNEFADVRVQILAHYQSKMKNQIKEMFGLNNVTTTEKPTSPGRFRSRINTKAGRRQDIPEIDEETQKKIDRIENYDQLNSYLTVKERNEFKDLGFKYIGEVIHLVIEKMGVEGGGEVKITLMESGHTKGHRVTKMPRKEATAFIETIEDKTR